MSRCLTDWSGNGFFLAVFEGCLFWGCLFLGLPVTGAPCFWGSPFLGPEFLEAPHRRRELP